MNELFAEVLAPIFNNPLVALMKNLCLLFALVLWGAIIFWTWRDADRRGAMPWFWALVVLMFNVFGWAVYMVVRPPEILEDAHERELEIRAREALLSREGQTCPSCHRPVEPDFLLCPSCMKKLRKECVSCGKALKLEWTVCPYCRTKQE